MRTALDCAVAGATKAGKAPGETTLVDAIFRYGIPYLQHALPSVMATRGRHVSVSGIFCHGSTFQVAMNRGGRCEIGDLLVLVRDTTGLAPVNTSLLLQAKLRKRGSRPSAAQRRLYEQWPTFSWRYGALSLAGSRDVRHAPHRGAQYAYLQPPPTVADSHYLRSAESPAAVRELALGLALMLFGLEGRRFSDYHPAQATRGWSRVMWDMIEATSAIALLSHRGLSRGTEVFRVGAAPMFLSAAPASSQVAGLWMDLPVMAEAGHETDDGNGTSGPRRPHVHEDDPGGSISILEFRVSPLM